jgi:hypothetical protein
VRVREGTTKEEEKGRKKHFHRCPSSSDDVRVVARNVLLTLFTVRPVAHRNLPSSLRRAHPNIVTWHRMRVVVCVVMLLLQVRRVHRPGRRRRRHSCAHRRTDMRIELRLRRTGEVLMQRWGVVRSSRNGVDGGRRDGGHECGVGEGEGGGGIEGGVLRG